MKKLLYLNNNIIKESVFKKGYIKNIMEKIIMKYDYILMIIDKIYLNINIYNTEIERSS